MDDESEFSEDSANDNDGGDANACGGRGPDANLMVTASAVHVSMIAATMLELDYGIVLRLGRYPIWRRPIGSCKRRNK